MLNRILLILLFFYQVNFSYNTQVHNTSLNNVNDYNLNNFFKNHLVISIDIFLNEDNFSENYLKNFNNDLFFIDSYEVNFYEEINLNECCLKCSIKIDKIYLSLFNFIENNFLKISLEDFIAKITYFSLSNNFNLKKSDWYVNKILFFFKKKDESINKTKNLFNFSSNCLILVFDKNILFGNLSYKRLKHDTYYVAFINLISNKNMTIDKKSESLFNYFKNNFKNSFEFENKKNFKESIIFGNYSSSQNINQNFLHDAKSIFKHSYEHNSEYNFENNLKKKPENNLENISEHNTKNNLKKISDLNTKNNFKYRPKNNFEHNVENNFVYNLGSNLNYTHNMKYILDYEFKYNFRNNINFLFNYNFLNNLKKNLTRTFKFENKNLKGFYNLKLNIKKYENDSKNDLKNDIQKNLLEESFKKNAYKRSRITKRSIMKKNLLNFSSYLNYSSINLKDENLLNKTNVVKDKIGSQFLFKNETKNELTQKSLKNNFNSLNQLNTFTSNLTNSINKPFTKSFINTTYDLNSINSTNFDIEIYLENPEEMLEPWIVNPYFFPIMVTYIISFIVGVTGNVLVFWLMFVNKENRNVTAMFLVSLSVSDLLLLIIYGPLEITNYFVLQWDKEGTICRLSAFAESVSAFGSVLNLVAVSFERFVVIVFPMQSLTLCAMHNCKRVLIGVWVLALFLSTPVLFIKTTINTTFTNYKTTVSIYYCKDINDGLTFTVYVYRFLTLFILPSLIMIVCYTWVIIELWISTKNLENCKTNLKKCTSSIEMNTLSFKYNSSINNKTNRIASKNIIKNNEIKNECSSTLYNDKKNSNLNLIQKDALSNLIEKNLSTGQLSELKIIDKKVVSSNCEKGLNFLENKIEKKIDSINSNSFEKIYSNLELNNENYSNIEKNELTSFKRFLILDKIDLEKSILEIDEFNLELSNNVSNANNNNLNLKDEKFFLKNNNLILSDKSSKDSNLNLKDHNLSLNEKIVSNNYYVDLNDNLESINKIIINEENNVESNQNTINLDIEIANKNNNLSNNDNLNENKVLDVKNIKKKEIEKLDEKNFSKNQNIKNDSSLESKKLIKKEKMINSLMNNLNENIEESEEQIKKNKDFYDGLVNTTDKNSLNEFKTIHDNELEEIKSLDKNSLVKDKILDKEKLFKTLGKEKLVDNENNLENISNIEKLDDIKKHDKENLFNKEAYDEKSLIKIKEKSFNKENLNEMKERNETKRNSFKSDTKKTLNKKEFLRKLSSPSIKFSKKIFFNNKNATNKKPLTLNTQTNSQLSSNCSINFNHQQPKVVLRTHFRKEAMDVKSARKQVIKMLILVVILFLICWGPRLTMEVVIKCCLDVFNNSTYTSRVIFYLLPFIHSCLNPFVYYFMSTKFRKQLIKFWQRLTKKKKLSKNLDNDINKQFSYKKSTFQSENNISKIITMDTVVN